MKSPTIALCLFTSNDLPMLRATLPLEMRWADQVCVLDMGSMDGTKEFCEAILRPEDVYRRRDTNTVPLLGFDEAYNAVMAQATTDWMMCSASDCFLDWTQRALVKPVLAETTADVLSVEMIHILNGQPECIEWAALNGKEHAREQRRCLIRRGAGIDYKGYLHEEPYRGPVNCMDECRPTPLKRYHMQSWGDDHARLIRVAWMYQRALEQPDFQKYTNRFWFDVWCKDHREDIRAWAAEYESKMKP